MLYPVQLPKASPILTLTHPSNAVWVVELRNGVDNRLTKHLIEDAIMPALNMVEKAWEEERNQARAKGDKEGGKGALVIVGKRDQDKFFSNGFDYPFVLKNPDFIPYTYNGLISRLLTFPIPTIAAINGHVFAAGFITALACDYRVITSDKKRRVWGCMNEVHFGAPLPPSFSALLRCKINNGGTLRQVALEGHRFTPFELLGAGLVDDVVDGGSEGVLARAVELADKWSENAKTGVWGSIREGAVKEVLEVVKGDDGVTAKARL